jgi:hypothetical protein
MKIFYFTGPNPKTKNGMSSKIWKIECKGCVVTTWNGAVDLIDRKHVVQWLRKNLPVHHPSEQEARTDERRRISAQISQEYKRKPRRAASNKKVKTHRGTTR